MFLEEFHDAADNFLMFIQCLSEDEDIIEVDHHYTFRDEVFEDSVHHIWKVAGLLVKPKNITSGS